MSEPCPTCQGPNLRETKGVVCQTCGTDYGQDADEARRELAALKRARTIINNQADDHPKEMRLTYNRPDGTYIELVSPDIRCYEAMVRIVDAVVRP